MVIIVGGATWLVRLRADRVEFKLVGFAREDVVTARLAYDRAVAAGLGTEVSL